MTKQNWQLGFLFSLITALLWGLLPIALKALLKVMDPNTITWYRFLVASVLLTAFLIKKGRFPSLRGLGKPALALLVLAVLGLTGNYVLYLVGLQKVSPETAQMVIQLAPMFLLLGGLLFFHERFQVVQWVGLAILSSGLLLFFNDRLQDLLKASGPYYMGVLIIVIAAISWAAYALAQKRLSRRLKSDQILVLLYIAAAIILLPVSSARQITALGGLEWALLLFCCLNTLVAYGCFGEALAFWEASRVSAVLAVTPLITLGFMWLIEGWFPGFVQSEHLNALSIAGSIMVVAGSMLAALGSRRRQIPNEPLPLD